jgi:hypothetical protein
MRTASGARACASSRVGLPVGLLVAEPALSSTLGRRGAVVTDSGRGVFGRRTLGVQDDGLSIGVLGTVFGPASGGKDVGVQSQRSYGVVGLGRTLP